MVIKLPLLEYVISKSENLIPSPVNKSAIPWSEAKVNNLAKTGIFLTLKLSIINLELEMLFIRISYGGMKSDLLMLERAMNLFEHESIEDVMHLIDEPEIPKIIDFKHAILLSSLDFHPTPWILNYIARKTNLSKERVKERAKES